MKIKFWLLIASGLLVRLILSLITYHSDMDDFDYAGKLVSEGNILNLYDFTSASAVLNYPPAIYLYHGFFKFIFAGVSSPLLLKSPYIFFDLLTGLLLYKLSGRKLWVLSLWIFNPVTLYATYMMGQFDIIPTFFIVLSVYLVARGRLDLAAWALGGGVAFKLSPVFLIIPLLVLGKSLHEKIKLAVFSLVPYLITIIPYIFSSAFRSTALFTNQSSKSLFAVVAVSGGEVIYLFPLTLLVFYLIILGSKIRDDISKLYLIPLLLFFILTHYHPQWLIWVTPLLILQLTSYRILLPIILIFVSWATSLFFFDPSLTLGIFSPIFLQTLSIWQILGISLDYNVARSIIQTIFASAAFYLIYKNFVQLKTTNETI